MSVLDIPFLLRTKSPLSHMSGTAGNVAILNTTRKNIGGTIYNLPFLSANAMRHNMVREPGAKFLLDLFREEDVELTLRAVQFFFQWRCSGKKPWRYKNSCDNRIV